MGILAVVENDQKQESLSLGATVVLMGLVLSPGSFIFLSWKLLLFLLLFCADTNTLLQISSIFSSSSLQDFSYCFSRSSSNYFLMSFTSSCSMSFMSSSRGSFFQQNCRILLPRCSHSFYFSMQAEQAFSQADCTRLCQLLHFWFRLSILCCHCCSFLSIFYSYYLAVMMIEFLVFQLSFYSSAYLCEHLSARICSYFFRSNIYLSFYSASFSCSFYSYKYSLSLLASRFLVNACDFSSQLRACMRAFIFISQSRVIFSTISLISASLAALNYSRVVLCWCWILCRFCQNYLCLAFIANSSFSTVSCRFLICYSQDTFSAWIRFSTYSWRTMAHFSSLALRLDQFYLRSCWILSAQSSLSSAALALSPFITEFNAFFYWLNCSSRCALRYAQSSYSFFIQNVRSESQILSLRTYLDGESAAWFSLALLLTSGMNWAMEQQQKIQIILPLQQTYRPLLNNCPSQQEPLVPV